MPVSPTDTDDTEDRLLVNDTSTHVDLSDKGGESEKDLGSNAEGSPASDKQDDNKPKNIADAVRAALDSGKEQSSGSGEEGGDKPGATDPKAAKTAGEEEELGELTDEELATYKGKTARRFKQFKEQTAAQAAEIDALKPEADKFRRVKQFVDNAGLSPEDVNTGMNIMAMMKNDPIKAYDALKPIFTSLEALVGVVLPADLQTQVTEGKLTPVAAQELSRLRATTGLTAQQREQKRIDDENKVNNDRVQGAEKLKDDVGTAITQWENRWKGSDPDYSLKSARVSEAIELELLRRMQTKTLPTSVAEAVKMADEVKKKVEKELLKFVPKKQAINPNPQVSGSTNGSKPAAKSVLDAVSQAVGYR